MGRKKPVTIGNHHFERQGDAEAYYKEILWRYQIGDELNDADSADVLPLFQRHRDFNQKIGPGIRRFIVMIADEGSRCFGVVRTDGAKVDFSYHRCITQRWD